MWTQKILWSASQTDKTCQCVSSINIFSIKNNKKNLLYAPFDPHSYPTDFWTTGRWWRHGGKQNIVLKGPIFFSPKVANDTFLTNKRKMSIWKESGRKKISETSLPLQKRNRPKIMDQIQVQVISKTQGVLKSKILLWAFPDFFFFNSGICVEKLSYCCKCQWSTAW